MDAHHVVDDTADLLRADLDSLAAGLSCAATRDDWLDVVARARRLANRLAAVEDAAVVEVARRESVWVEDGTVGEQVHPAGVVALDAAAVVAPVLGCSQSQASRRVEQAVRVAAAREPVEVDADERPAPNGLGGLHDAMGEGRLDAYRAGVLVDELELAPADVADAVVRALDPHLHESSAALRRRCRQVIARISPDLLRQRAVTARQRTGLRRWAVEPGVDAWYGTFPSEDAATAWLAVDRLAHEYVADGRCTSLEQARGRALTDLVTTNASVDVRVVLAVPAGGVAEDARRALVDGHADDLVTVHGARPSEPMLVRRGWLAERLDPAEPVACHPRSGARLDVGDVLATGAYRPSPRLVALVRARDGRCRFPGCAVPARSCDLDHVRPWPSGPTSALNLVCLCRRHHRVKQLPGWSLRLTAEAVATWTDPFGRVHTTEPLDALEDLVLVADPADLLDPVATADLPRLSSAPDRTDDRVDPPPGGPSPPWSAVESRLDMLLDDHRTLLARHRRCTSSAMLRRSVRGRIRPAPVRHEPPPF